MTNVEYGTKNLVKEIRKSNEYNQYHRLKKKIAASPELMQKVDEYRKQCFYLQARDKMEDDQALLTQLREDNQDVLSNAAVHEFLVSEQRLCRMIQKVLTSVTESANLDLSFL